MKIYFNYADESFTNIEPKKYDLVFETDLDLEYLEERYFNLRMYGETTQNILESLELC